MLLVNILNILKTRQDLEIGGGGGKFFKGVKYLFQRNRENNNS